MNKCSSGTGTHMTQDDYLKLEKAVEDLVGHCDCSTVMSDAEAIILVNKEFGFEASRIEILREGELNITSEGSRYIKIDKVPRKPLFDSTDWNYVRFNVHAGGSTWYYEMINGELYQVNI